MSRAQHCELTHTQSREKSRAGIIAAGCRHDGDLKQRVDISTEHTWSWPVWHHDNISHHKPSRLTPHPGPVISVTSPTGRSGRRVVVSPRHKLPADVESFTVSLAGSAVQQWWWWWWWWCAPLVQLGLLHHNSPACTRLYWGQIKILIKINRESPPCPGSRVSFYLFPLQKLLITVTGNHLALTEHSGKHQRL